MNLQVTTNAPSHHLPLYNIKAVARLVGLLPVTLRAWERRYGLPNPSRGEQGYRLYSEYDLRTLNWLKSQLESGLSISRAIETLNELRRVGNDPAEQILPRIEALPAATNTLSEHLASALLQFNEQEATDIMRQAFALYSVDQVLIEVVQPSLVSIGEAWHRGEIPIAKEHYATQFFMQHLMNMMCATAPSIHQGLIIAACAPGELHQIGLLMIVVMLRWRGWDVKYLGPNLSLDRLEEALVPIKPRMLLFTATRTESAKALEGLPAILLHFRQPQPLVVLGGQAFKANRLPESVPAIYLETSPVQTVNTIERLMQQTN